MIPKNRAPAHPGEILDRIFLKDIGLSQSELAKHLGWKPGKVNEIVNGKRGITPESALALADALGTDSEMWLNLQTNFDLWQAKLHHRPIKPIKIGA